MNKTFCTAVATIAVSIASLQCTAQVSKVSSEDIMDAAFDMKRASDAADKLAADGSKYCRWSIASLDTSDLEVAISRLLLNHGANVPENVSASKMWRVSFVGADITNQLAMRTSECDLNLRYSDEARSVSLAASSALFKLMLARGKFNNFAYQQTIWQEQNSQERGNTDSDERQGTGKVTTDVILVAASEMREAAEAVGKLTTESQATSGCVHVDTQARHLIWLT
jgi:hypothetical protein